MKRFLIFLVLLIGCKALAHAPQYLLRPMSVYDARFLWLSGLNANQDLNINPYGFNLNHITFDLTPVGECVEGQIMWDSEEGTIKVGMPGGQVCWQAGQEIFLRAKEDTGQEILNGDVVYISGASGSRAKVSKADASNFATSFVAGVATEDITSANGYITITGLVHNVNTDGMTAGDVLWLSETTGKYTNIRPTPPAMSVFIGYVVHVHATEGVILVSPVLVPRLSGLSDVYISGSGVPTLNNILQWNSSNARWENTDNPKFGSSTDYVSISSTGIISFNGNASIVMPHLMQSDSTDQTIADIANAQVITFDTDNHHSGFTRTSSSRFTVTRAGSYLITFSGMAVGTATKKLDFWLKKNADYVASSNTEYQFKGTGTSAVVSCSYLVHFSVGDYFEFWTWGDDTSCKWDAIAAGTSPTRPAIPSVIITANYVGSD